MQESKYDHYASMREYTQMDALHQLNDNVMNEHHSDGSDIDIPAGNMDVGRGRKTANDTKQWMFVVRRTPQSALAVNGDVARGRGGRPLSDESQPLLSVKHGHHPSATDSLNALHQAQTRSTLEMDIRRTGTVPCSISLCSYMVWNGELDLISMSLIPPNMYSVSLCYIMTPYPCTLSFALTAF